MAQKLHCSFCGKSQDEVKKLIKAGKGTDSVFICNECVLGCLGVLSSDNADPRYKELTHHAARLSLEDALEIVEADLLRLEAERENLLHDIAASRIKPQ